MNVFQRADEIDRAGKADRATAQSFYAAATFFEILKQFSPTRELDEDVKQTQLYAKWVRLQIVLVTVHTCFWLGLVKMVC